MLGLWTLILLLAAALPGAANLDQTELTDEERAALSGYYGFAPLEVYKLDRVIGLLRIADVDTDGRKDAILWNARRSRFEILYQPNPADPNTAVKPQSELERNELANRGRLRNETLAATYRVASFEIADMTGDQRNDIVFFGEPREVVIVPGRPGREWGSPIRERAPEGNPRGGALAVGDFNGDKRADVALLGENVLLLFHQHPEGGLTKPERFVHNVSGVGMMIPVDLNGDKREDLMIATDDKDYGILVYLQTAAGTLGPMRRVRTPEIRSITIGRNASGPDDVYVVEAATGRLRHLRWEQPDELAAQDDWPQLLYSYPIEFKAKNPLFATGDIDADGWEDLIAIEPDAAQMVLFRGATGGLLSGVSFPTLVKPADASIANMDGQAGAELIVLSPEEKLVAISRSEDGRLSFPTPLAGLPEQVVKPLVIRAGSLKTDGPAEAIALLALARPVPAETQPNSAAPRDNKDAKEQVQLFVRGAANEAFRSFPVGELRVPEDVTGVRFADVDQDGDNDLLVFVRFAPLITFLQNAPGEFARFEGRDARLELVKEASLEGSTLADVNNDGKPELLLTQKNLARALAIKDGKWTVIDQFNPENSDAQITGLAMLPATAAPDLAADRPLIVLYDRRGGDLLVFASKEGGAYAVARRIAVGNFGLRLMTSAMVARQPAILLADASRLACVTPGARGETLIAKHTYETNIKEAFLQDSVVGDFNGDNRRDLVAVDTRKAHLEILATRPDGEIIKAMHFQVFQGKRFSGEPDRGGEPREVLAGDLDGDGRDDIVLIVHDRVIVYPGQ